MTTDVHPGTPTSDVDPGTPRRPWAAALLSLLMPGLGQLYSGRPWRALLAYLSPLLTLLLLLVGVAASFPLLVALLAFGLALWIAVHVDAVRLARRTTGFRLRWYNRWYVYLGLLLLAGFCVPPLLQATLRSATYPARTYFIPSGNMEPTLLIGDSIVVERVGAPRRNDLVVFESIEMPGRSVVKRIVAVAGDRVEIRAKRLYVNGRPAGEPWVRHNDPLTYPDSAWAPGPGARRDHLPAVRVPAGHVFVLGDNRDHSHDSRFFGPLPVENLRARPIYIYWSRDRSRIGRSLKL